MMTVKAIETILVFVRSLNHAHWKITLALLYCFIETALLQWLSTIGYLFPIIAFRRYDNFCCPCHEIELLDEE